MRGVKGEEREERRENGGVHYKDSFIRIRASKGNKHVHH